MSYHIYTSPKTRQLLNICGKYNPGALYKWSRILAALLVSQTCKILHLKRASELDKVSILLSCLNIERFTEVL